MLFLLYTVKEMSPHIDDFSSGIVRKPGWERVVCDKVIEFVVPVLKDSVWNRLMINRRPWFSGLWGNSHPIPLQYVLGSKPVPGKTFLSIILWYPSFCYYILQESKISFSVLSRKITLHDLSSYATFGLLSSWFLTDWRNPRFRSITLALKTNSFTIRRFVLIVNWYSTEHKEDSNSS